MYLDNDTYVVRSLDVFKRYKMAVGITDGTYLGTQLLIANKYARFLKLWLESYRDYNPDSWYYNAGQKPMWEIFIYKPELVHAVTTLLGVLTLSERLYMGQLGQLEQVLQCASDSETPKLHG
jgi:predicted choloylglycine hydrolase